MKFKALKRSQIILISIVTTIILCGVVAYAWIALTGMIGNPGTIDSFGGIQGGTVFKLISTNDPNSQNFEQDPYQYVLATMRIIKPNGSMGNSGQILHFDHMEHHGVPVPPSNNGYLFIPKADDLTWIKALLGNPEYAQSQEWTYVFEDVSPSSSDYRKTVTLVNFSRLANDCGAKFTK